MADVDLVSHRTQPSSVQIVHGGWRARVEAECSTAHDTRATAYSDTEYSQDLQPQSVCLCVKF